MVDGHQRCGQIADGVLIQDDAAIAVLGQHAVRPCRWNQQQRPHRPLTRSRRRFQPSIRRVVSYAKQLTMRLVLVVFDEPKRGRCAWARPRCSTKRWTASAEARASGSGLSGRRSPRWTFPRGSEMRVEHRGPRLAFCARTRSLAAESREIFGARWVGKSPHRPQTWPDNRHVGPARGEGVTTRSSRGVKRQSTTIRLGVTRGVGRASTVMGYCGRATTRTCRGRPRLEGRPVRSPHRSDVGSACTTLQGERGVACANEEVSAPQPMRPRIDGDVLTLDADDLRTGCAPAGFTPATMLVGMV